MLLPAMQKFIFLLHLILKIHKRTLHFTETAVPCMQFREVRTGPFAFRYGKSLHLLGKRKPAVCTDCFVCHQ